MGELLLCNQEIASMPYYIENVSLNIYSLEELCYYLKYNIDLIEPEFMDEELLRWLETELKLTKTAGELRRMIAEGKSLAQFAGAIMNSCGYCTKEEIFSMQQILEVFENKSEFECRKIRADRFLQKKKYVTGILEYWKLIEEAKECEYAPEFTGNVWHNLGTAYAGLFYFKEAAECYLQAFLLNRNQESLRQQKEAQRLLEESEKDVMTFPEELESEIEDWYFPTKNGDYSHADELLHQWKEDYQRSCKS